VHHSFGRRLAMITFIAGALQLFATAYGAQAATAAPEPARQTAKLQPSSTGYDISYPQCSAAFPKSPAFGIIGVNGGLAYATNPCLASEYAWAQTSTSAGQPHVSFYLNTGNPGPVASTHWPPPGTTTPQACDGSWSQACAYDYGWSAAQDSFSKAAAASGSSAARTAPWWLDVETANSWSNTDLATKEMLMTALGQFDGTMIFVSHDRMFLRGLSNRVLELGGESGLDAQPHAYPGSYVEYVARSGHEAPGVRR